MKIAFITSSSTSDFAPDDRFAVEVAKAKGHTVESFVWDESNPKDLTQYDGAVIRSVWDYYQKFEKFQNWLGEVDKNSTRIWNSTPLLRWNASKEYLFELEKAGIPIVPSWIVNEENLDKVLAALDEKFYSKSVVIKPTISAASDMTFLVPRADTNQIREKLKQIQTRSPALLQPYCKSIETIGEYSLIYFNSRLGREFSHAVLKSPEKGDFRVQIMYGGTITPVRPSEALIQRGALVLDALKDPWLYARVDLVLVDDEFCVGEVETIEPHLYFQYDEQAPSRFLKHLEAHCLH
jgi:glutathione synthase/RimK-type ligase-like ATP-grasp enzyme